MMDRGLTRRQVAKSGAVAAGSMLMGVPSWTLADMTQEQEVPFTDMPDGFETDPTPIVRFVDIRRIDEFFTPADEFFTIQHYGQPDIDVATHSLEISGLVTRPQALSVADLRRRPRTEVACAFECSGNSRRRFNGLISNGLWGGTSLRALLDDVGVAPAGKEVVFFGADEGTETIESRGNSWQVDQQYARSLSLEDAMRDDTMLAYELNGEPLSLNQGAPLRVIVPGWYGVAQVKWLNQIHVQADRFMGKFMAREYVTLTAEQVGESVKYTETSITRIQLKSAITRVTRGGGHHTIHGFALTDGTPLRSVEVKVDDGPWEAATLDSRNTKYSWKLFAYRWEGAGSGEHTIVSRATDTNGNVQPVLEDLAEKRTSWENNAQFARTVMIS